MTKLTEEKLYTVSGILMCACFIAFIITYCMWADKYQTNNRIVDCITIAINSTSTQIRHEELCIVRNLLREKQLDEVDTPEFKAWFIALNKLIIDSSDSNVLGTALCTYDNKGRPIAFVPDLWPNGYSGSISFIFFGLMGAFGLIITYLKY